MTQVDIARVALGAPALQQVFVVSRPECLLVKAWARNERSNTEDAAALIGNLFKDCDDALLAVGGQNEPRTLMVESSDRVVVVSRVAEDMAAAFVFEQSAPLGLIRVQARQLTAQLARTMAADPSPPPQPNATQRPTAPPARPPPTAPPARPPPVSQGPQTAAASVRAPAIPTPQIRPPVAAQTRAAPPGVTAAPPPARPPHSSPSPTPAPSPAAAHATHGTASNAATARRPVSGSPTRPPAHSPPAHSPPSPNLGKPLARPPNTPLPPNIAQPPVPKPTVGERSPAFGVTPAAPKLASASESANATPNPNEQLTARISAFTQAAPDPRSALLRLSLRTGLPMELLERASTLSRPQADMVGRALDELQKKQG